MGDTFLPHLASQSTRCALVCSKCLPLRPDCSMLPLWRLGFTCSTSLCRRLESSRFFTASLFFAGRSCLCFSRRVASLQVGLSQALSSSSRRVSSSLQHPSPTQIRTVHQQIRPSRWIHIFNWQHICDPRFFDAKPCLLRLASTQTRLLLVVWRCVSMTHLLCALPLGASASNCNGCFLPFAASQPAQWEIRHESSGRCLDLYSAAPL